MIEEKTVDSKQESEVQLNDASQASKDSEGSKNLEVNREEDTDNVKSIDQANNESLASTTDNNKINKKKEKKLYEEIEIPEGITVNATRNEISMKKDDKELIRKTAPLINVKLDGNKIQISADRIRKNERKLFGTMKAHVNNMIKGLTEGFTYKLQVANVHFPMAVSYDKENNELVVKNFLGEKKDRRIKLVKDIDVKIDKEVIEVTSHDIEKAGQAATNIEKGTKTRNKDRRIYQDGIFITEKPGRVYLQ